EPPKPEPKPEPEPEPEPKPDIIPLPGNWGVTPPAMRAAFEKTEEAAGIPGLGRFLAIWSWGAFRAKKPPVGAEEAAAIAEANPQLCRLCHNDSASERAASLTALNRVIQPKPLGAYDKPWPKPADVEGWSDGSYGLFDVLAGAHAHAGYHDGHFAPLIDHPATILYRVDVQCYIAGVMVQRIINNPTLLVLVDDDPLQTWANVRACTSTPQGFIDLLKGKDSAIKPGSNLPIGTAVKRGQVIAAVGKYPKGSTMLHWEAWKLGTRKPRARWSEGKPRPADNYDPSDYLKRAMSSASSGDDAPPGGGGLAFALMLLTGIGVGVGVALRRRRNR
ncbi:MAG: hypothetical protein KC486_36570, partial [Myxococcales bacterium]|nr:hypothetical protein [Myxococcales bacterium]